MDSQIGNPVDIIECLYQTAIVSATGHTISSNTSWYLLYFASAIFFQTTPSEAPPLLGQLLGEPPKEVLKQDPFIMDDFGY